MKGVGNAVIPTFPTRWSHGLQHLRHKRPTFAFTSERGYTLGFRRRIAHKGSHAETGVFRTGVVSLPSDCFTRFGNPAWPGSRTAYFAAFGSWPRMLPKASRPRWAALLCLQLGDVAVLSLCAQYFLNVRGVGGITTLGALCVFSKRWTTACQSGYPLLVRLHPSVIRAICNLHNVANITL